MNVPEEAKGWVDKGIYLLKNEVVAQPHHWAYEKQNYVPVSFRFKVKTIRPVLYYCTVRESYGDFRVTLNRINSVNQFENQQYAPRESLSVSFSEGRKPYYSSCPEIAFTPDDFIFLGVEEKVSGNYWRPFSNTDAPQILKWWEGEAIAKGYFTPSENPLFKSKADKERETAKDFFGQDVKRGDTVAYVVLTGYQRIHTGQVTNITVDNFVIDKSYTAPHSYVIKCPEGFKPKRF